MHSDKDFERVKDKTELENREAAGFWRAIALSKEIGMSEREIDLNVMLEINACILKDAIPESAGKLRITGQDILKLPCVEPPPGSKVRERVYEFEKDMKQRMETLSTVAKSPGNIDRQSFINDVFDLAAWIQHSIAAIHPFSEANGRTARLMTNIIVRRFHFPPSDVKIEAENKEEYINALCQVDKFGDYEPLKNLILRGSLATLKKEEGIRRRKQAT